MASGVNSEPANAGQKRYEVFGRLAQADTANAGAREIYGDSSGPIPLTIELPNVESAEYKFLMISGMPDDFRMSSGFRTKNAWLVSIRDASKLRIVPSSGYSGQFLLHVLLVTEGNKSDEQIIAVTIGPKGDENLKNVAPNVASTAATSPKAEAEPARARPAKKQISEERENASMQRAAEFVDNADISAARLIYETLAMKGSASAAFAMGQTFDPEFLTGKRIEGLKPDIERARSWYKKAIELGSPDAEAKLVNLDAR
jgi:TPR repeat protein